MEFPKRLYGEGLEPEVKKINNSCRLSLLTILEETMLEEYQAVMRDPLFKHIMAIQKNGLRFSGRLVHSFLCKELVTSKVHEKWFIFARRPLRFSLQEYHAVTGLEIGMEGDTQVVRWQDDKGFWSQILKTNGKINLKTLKDEHIQVAYKWDRADRIRLIYLCIIMGVIFGRDEKVHIPHLYIKLAMDLDKLRKYPWGLHSYDFLLSSIDKARKKLGQKDGFMMEGFLFALQIWIMEAIPDFGVMCGHKVKDNYVGPRCGNWTGCARVSYEDINGLEMVFSDKGQLFSYISRTGNGDVVCSGEYFRVDERKDERVDRMQQMINEKYDWSEFQWEPLEPESTEVEEGNEEEGEAQLDTENAEETDVTGDLNGSASESGRGKRKIPDKGAESRKMKLLCQRSAAMKGTLDAEAKLFLEGLVSSSFNSMAEKLITQVNERMDKLESELTDLKVAVDLVGIRNTVEPQTCGPSKINPPQSKKKAAKKTNFQDDDCDDNLPGPNLTQTSDIGLGMGTQEFLKSCMKNLSQDEFVKGFDPSQTKVEDPLEWLTPRTSFLPKKKSKTELSHRKIEVTKDSCPDGPLVFVSDEDWEKVHNWSISRTDLQLGPHKLTFALADRIMNRREWIQNAEIDAMMYVFRERTTLRRWSPDRVGFMTCVFSYLIGREYKEFLKGRRKYNMDKALFEYGRGERPTHGRTLKVWSIDVDRVYIPVWVSGNHWIALCVSFVNRTVEVFDCGGKKKIKEVEAFSVLIPRIVKAVQPESLQKHLNVSPYSVFYAPMGRLNKSGCDCGAYTMKFIEYHVLGMDISLMDDDNIKEARLKILWDLWEAANDTELIERMANYVPPPSEPSEVVEIK